MTTTTGAKSMTTVVNPTTFTIGDANITANSVTGFQVQFGQKSGGPYTLTANVPAADINATAGTVTGTLASLNEQLAAGTWYAVAEAINAGGVSSPSPEVSFSIVPPVPTAPTSFTVA